MADTIKDKADAIIADLTAEADVKIDEAKGFFAKYKIYFYAGGGAVLLGIVIAAMLSKTGTLF